MAGVIAAVAIGSVLMAGGYFALRERGPEHVVYRKVDGVDLALHVFAPRGHAASDRRPAVLFFHGGGWESGDASQFHPQCRFLARRGLWAASVEYRIRNRHGTDARAAVADARAALRFVREHADALGIDARRVAAAGGSSGGHLAAALATDLAFDEPGAAPATRAVPDAVVLFNPILDLSPGRQGHERVREYWRAISPLHHVGPGMPPAIVFLGSDDPEVPVSVAEAFRDRMRAAGARSELVVYAGQGHGFFNPHVAGGRYLDATNAEMARFLATLGYLDADAAR